MRARKIGFIGLNGEQLFRRYRGPAEDRWMSLRGALLSARDEFKKANNSEEVVYVDDGTWRLVSRTEKTKTYTSKDALMVALTLKGIDVSELEKVNVVDNNE